MNLRFNINNNLLDIKTCRFRRRLWGKSFVNPSDKTLHLCFQGFYGIAEAGSLVVKSIKTFHLGPYGLHCIADARRTAIKSNKTLHLFS